MKQYDQHQDDSRELKPGEYVAEPVTAYGNESKRTRSTPPPKMPALSKELGARVAVVETTLAHVQENYATNLAFEKYKEEIRQIVREVVREEIQTALKDVATKEDLEPLATKEALQNLADKAVTKEDLHASEKETRKEIAENRSSAMNWVVGMAIGYSTSMAALVIYVVERLA